MAALAAPETPSSESLGASSEATRRAAERYEEGVRAYSAGRYEDAIKSFRAADGIAQSPALSFNTAIAYDKLLDTAGALAHYREYLRRDPKAARADTVRERIRELEALLAVRGVQQLTVQSEPPGATVVIDETAVGVTPWTGELRPGPHDLRLRLPGHYDSVQRVSLALDHAVAFDFRLNRALELPLQKDLNDPAANESRATLAAVGMSPWPWVAFGASAASLLTAGTFELLRQGSARKAKSQTVQIEFQQAVEDAKAQQRNARIFAGIGGGLAVTGVVLLVALRPTRPRSTALACDADGCFGSFATEF